MKTITREEYCQKVAEIVEQVLPSTAHLQQTIDALQKGLNGVPAVVTCVTELQGVTIVIYQQDRSVLVNAELSNASIADAVVMQGNLAIAANHAQAIQSAMQQLPPVEEGENGR